LVLLTRESLARLQHFRIEREHRWPNHASFSGSESGIESSSNGLDLICAHLKGRRSLFERNACIVSRMTYRTRSHVTVPKLCAVDLVSAFHNLFDSQALADYIAARNNTSCDSSGDRFFTGDEKRLCLDGILLPAAPLQNSFCIFNHRRMAAEISVCVFPSKSPEVRVFAD
jgi:hypothetical protein